MMFPGRERYQKSAVQFECRHLIADYLDSFWRRLSYRLPHALKEALNIVRKSLDVFVDRRELFLRCHVFKFVEDAENQRDLTGERKKGRIIFS